MFETAFIEPIEYSDPWKLSFEQRLSMLMGAPRRIAYFYEKPDTSTFRYRVFNMVDSLNSGNDVSASWFHLDDLPKMHQVIERIDALVFCRTKYSPSISRMVAHAKNRGVRVIYDIDDLVFNSDYVHLVLDTLDQDVNFEPLLDNFFAYCSRNGALLKICDHAITTNPFLAGQISAFAPHVTTSIVPNFLNRAQQGVSETMYERKAVTGFASSAPYHIGYFSGTPTHRRDFAVVAQTLARLLDSYDDIRLVIVGFLEPGPWLERHVNRIDQYPLQDFLNLQRLIGITELNIAPLIDNTFTNCKSELKFFEAAITGTITVATPTFTFANSISDGENGFLARSHEWDLKIARAMELVRDRDQYREMAVRGFEYAKQNYGWNQHRDTLIKSVFGDFGLDGVDVTGMLDHSALRGRNRTAITVPIVPKVQLDRKQKLTDGLDLQAAVGAEIGALGNPTLSKSEANILYVDYADADSLRKHYAGNSFVDPEKIVETDAIWGKMTLKEALGRQVDFVIASHVIEHVPDLIAWLNELESVLSSGGEIRLAVPDRRFTFDFLRRETEIAEVLAASLARARVPQPYSILDYYLNATEVDCQAAWRGEITRQSLKRPDNLETVMNLAKDTQENGTYHDAHCWVFTPKSFANLFLHLVEAGFTNFACDHFFDTEPNTIEFFVTLKLCNDRNKVIESWNTMLSRTSDSMLAREKNMVRSRTASSAANGVALMRTRAAG